MSMTAKKLPSVYLIFLYSLIILVFTNCEQDDSTPKGEFLLQYHAVNTFSQNDLVAQLSFASIYYPGLADIAASTKFGVTLYKISYATEFQGNKITASGLVSVPNTATELPLLSFQNGTNTCNASAPSVNSNDPLFSLVAAIAGNGYIISIADYLGFGASSNIIHPYMHRISSDQSVRDMLNATKELIDILGNTASNGELYLMGYSQGGWATLSLLESLEQTPIPGLTPRAAACGGGSYDLLDMTKNVLQKPAYPNPMYMGYFVYSRIENNIISGTLDDYFTTPYNMAIPQLFDGTQCNEAVNNQLPDTLTQLLTSDVFSLLQVNNNVPSLENQLIINSVEAFFTQANLKLFHSRGDQSVPYEQSEIMFDRFVEKGLSTQQISLSLIDSLDHNDAVIPWGVDAIIWLNNR